MGAMIAIAPPAESNRETPGDPDDLGSTCCSIASSIRLPPAKQIAHDPRPLLLTWRVSGRIAPAARSAVWCAGATSWPWVQNALAPSVSMTSSATIAEHGSPPPLSHASSCRSAIGSAASFRPRAVTWSLCPRRRTSRSRRRPSWRASSTATSASRCGGPNKSASHHSGHRCVASRTTGLASAYVCVSCTPPSDAAWRSHRAGAVAASASCSPARVSCRPTWESLLVDQPATASSRPLTSRRARKLR